MPNRSCTTILLEYPPSVCDPGGHTAARPCLSPAPYVPVVFFEHMWSFTPPSSLHCLQFRQPSTKHPTPIQSPTFEMRHEMYTCEVRRRKGEEGRDEEGRKDGGDKGSYCLVLLFSCSLLFSLFSLFSFFSLFLSPHLELAHARPHVGHCAAQLMAGDARVFLNGREGEEDRLWRKNE